MSEGNYALGPRGSKDAFFAKMKKKPDVQAVLDNLENYTVEELANLQGTHFPQWVRDALIRRRQGETDGRVMSRAEAIAEKMIAASQVHTPILVPEYVQDVYTPKAEPTERKITSADFNTEKEKTGIIFDSSSHGKHEEEPGFEEHMKRVREQMRNKS